MKKYIFLICAAAISLLSQAQAGVGSLTYRASVVHNNRSYMSVVNGVIDLETGDFEEEVEQSYFLNWKQVPAGFSPTGAALPVVSRVDSKIAHHFESGLPSFDSPLLRHFVISEVISGGDRISKGELFLDGQLEIVDVQDDQSSFEYICSFMGSPLVIVGRKTLNAERWLIKDIAVLGATQEMYQYIMDDIAWIPDPPEVMPVLPRFEPEDYVSFPQSGSAPVPIRPVKDWLVFQGSLPNGRPLNLVLDSGSETSIIDDMVLELDAQLKPEGEMLVAGAFQTESMDLYTGFSFNVGGVEFSNLPVAGTALTSLAYGADLRIHGIVGSDILRLCRLDIDLENGTLMLSPPGANAESQGVQLPLTFIHDLPHIPADVLGKSDSLLLLDTGQRSSLQVNIDLLEENKLDDELVMNGFLGGIAGGLQPRYMLENLDVKIAGELFEEREVDALMANSYNFKGQPVVGTVGFAMLSGHYSGVSIDYQNRQINLLGAKQNREFSGQPEAWEIPAAPTSNFLANLSTHRDDADDLPANVRPKELPSTNRPTRLGPGTQSPDSNYEQILKQLTGSSPGDLRASAPGLAVLLNRSGGNPGESIYIAKLLEQINQAGAADDGTSTIPGTPVVEDLAVELGSITGSKDELASAQSLLNFLDALASKLALRIALTASDLRQDTPAGQDIEESKPADDPFADSRKMPKLKFSPLTGPGSNGG